MDFNYSDMRNLDVLYRYGEHLNDVELNAFIKFHEMLFKALCVMGEEYTLARNPIQARLDNLMKMKEARIRNGVWKLKDES
jgi:TRAP-type mannitol/chloroaromatic compound transport system permease small subunit